MDLKPRKHALIGWVIGCLLLAGCSSTSPIPIAISASTTAHPVAATPSPPPSTTARPVAPPIRISGFEARQVDVGGHRLFIYCMGEGSPTVIMEGGLGLAGRTSWGQVPRGVAAFTRACVYDRAGLGASDPAATPRTSQQTVGDLHELLRNANIPGPYVLAGVSFGGMNVRLYASEHPADVVGLVLVEDSHEEQIARSELPEDPQEREQAQAYLRGQNEEGINLVASSDQVRAARKVRPVFDVPLIVLTRGMYLFPPDVSENERQQIQQDWEELQADLVTISPQGKQIVVEESEHGIPQSKPDAVTDAIREVVEAARGR